MTDFGQGHEKGGTKAHAANRKEVLERLRRPIWPMIFGTNYFMRSWDARRVMALGHFEKPAWGSRFLNTMVELHEEMKRNPRETPLHVGCAVKCP